MHFYGVDTPRIFIAYTSIVNDLESIKPNLQKLSDAGYQICISVDLGIENIKDVAVSVQEQMPKIKPLIVASNNIDGFVRPVDYLFGIKSDVGSSISNWDAFEETNQKAGFDLNEFIHHLDKSDDKSLEWLTAQASTFPREVAGLLHFAFRSPMMDSGRVTIEVFLKDEKLNDVHYCDWARGLLPGCCGNAYENCFELDFQYPNEMRQVYDNLLMAGFELYGEHQEYLVDDLGDEENFASEITKQGICKNCG
jgi:hypothetical protein